MTSAVLLAAEGEYNPGPIGLLIVVVLAVATVLLIRNMTGRLKRLPPSFPDDDARAGEDDAPSDDVRPGADDRP